MSIEYPCVYWSNGMCKKFSDDKVTSWCVEGPCVDQMPSNADKIRAMSDEELAKFLHEPFCDKRTHEECTISYCGVCDQCVLDWLQQPVKENDYD